MSNSRGLVTGFLVVAQVVFIILFGLFTEYDSKHTGPKNASNLEIEDKNKEDEIFYPVFQDVQVMMLVGFGFLMTFLKRNGFGAVGFNFLLTSYVIQWSLLINGCFNMIGSDESVIKLSLESFLHADFAVAAVLISYGAIIGVSGPVQLVVLATVEVIFYNISLYATTQLMVSDVGGSMVIHAFGAYFGLAASFVLSKFSPYESSKEGSAYYSDIFAMIGTVFLWLFWPSFNAGPATGSDRQRAIINTILSLSACTTVTFAMSALVHRKNKISMVHVQNAAIAGGVAMGASADFLVQPFGALIIGSLAAVLSVIGYNYIQPLLEKKLGLHDTCGVHNLHGMPGVLGALFSAIFAAMATESAYIDSFDSVIRTGDARKQAAVQIYSLLIVLAISIGSGIITGLLISLKFLDRLANFELYEDNIFWEVRLFSFNSSI